MNRTPYGSDYLRKIDEQVKQPTLTKPQSPVAGEQLLSENARHKRIAPVEPQQPGSDRNNVKSKAVRRNNATSPDDTAGRFITNNRMPMGLHHAPIAPSPSPTTETPSLTNYLHHLGEQEKAAHANQERDTPGEPQTASGHQNEGSANTGRRNRSIAPDDTVSHRIDNRRTGAEQVVQPASHSERPHWADWLGWFVAHSKRPDTSRRLSGTETNPNETNTTLHTGISLGIWGYYFAVKLALLWMNLISFHPLENLALAVLILFSSSSLFLHRIKNILIFIAALALFYYDTWLPPITRVISRAPSLSDFKLVYLVELITRFISLPVIAVLLAVCLVYWIVSHLLRTGALIIACLVALSLFDYPTTNWIPNPSNTVEQTASSDNSKPDMNKVEQNFYDNEAQRAVLFPIPQEDAAPFDVLFIQVCSLSWDDLHYAGLDQHPLWQRFDILLTKFNSAASYSGPAAIRLLRATCGQPKHNSMYSTAYDNCYLMNSLSNSGFETTFAMNHDGKFDDLLGQIKSYGQVTVPPLPLNGLKITQRSFNNSPVYDDLMVLNRWREARQKSTSSRVALYYHTGSLHDGNFLLGAESLPNTLQTYRKRLLVFLDEMEKFMQALEESGKNTVVIMVPEHGGAVRGDSRQISGLREIPTPAITLVPVGIKVIGGNSQRTGDALLIGQATSYLAISHIVARMLENSPFTKDAFAPSDYVANLPTTQFVAQTENTTVIEESGQFHLKIGSSGWEDYTEFNISTNR